MLLEYLNKAWPNVFDAYTPAARAELAKAYAEPHRGYHDTSHILDLLQKLEKFRADARRPDLIAHAILWHDVVYQTHLIEKGGAVHRPDALNVADSAARFEAVVQAGGCKLHGVDRDEVLGMIRATDGHTLGTLSPDAPAYNDRALFLDLDLSPLALPWDEFARNTDRIRMEYPHVPEAQFCEGRAKFFDGYGQKEVLFYHPKTATLFDEAARSNMRRSAQELRRRAARLRTGFSGSDPK